MSITEILKIAASLLLGLCFLIIFPAVIMETIRRRPQWLTGKTILPAMIGVSAFSWCTVNALWFVPMILNLRPIEGPEAALAIAGGWLYIWLAGIPYWLIAGVLLYLRSWRKP